jgi:hypothetical protein
MMGACIAARHERTKLRRINGNGSNGFQMSAKEFIAIHKRNTPEKLRMNFQLPPNSAILSARRSPSVNCRSNSILMFLDMSSCSF